MITSIFKKSKPINLVIVGLLVVGVFVMANYSAFFNGLTSIFLALFRLFSALLSILLLDFIVSTNRLTKNNSYAILFFGLFFCLFPEVLSNTSFLVAHLFLIFSLRRLISLQTKVETKKKFFDAGLCIGIAAIFYLWAILYFALVLLALLYYAQNDIKNSIVPALGLLTAFILLVVYNILFFDVYVSASNTDFTLSLDFMAYNTKSFLPKLALFCITLIGTLGYYIYTNPQKNKKQKPSRALIILALFVSVVMSLLAPQKDGSELVFVFVPLSIITANFIASISIKWVKEFLVASFLILPILTWLL